MKIGSNNEYLELKELERTPQDLPGAGDINLQVNLKLQDFQGSYSGVWIEPSAMEEFLKELAALEESGEGKAGITSISPEEFVLEIRSTDDLGHLEIETHLHRYQYSSGYKYWPIHLKGGFGVQPEAVKQLVSCFMDFSD